MALILEIIQIIDIIVVEILATRFVLCKLCTDLNRGRHRWRAQPGRGGGGCRRRLQCTPPTGSSEYTRTPVQQTAFFKSKIKT